MANYATLKAAVQDVVKSNGNKEITGTNMQSTLLGMITSLASGYIFKGVATPSTAPGTPDENVFYVGGAGTYSNFGSTPLEVKMGEIGIFKGSGSSWSNQALSVYSFANDLIGTDGVLSETGKSILQSAVDVPFVIKDHFVNVPSAGTYVYTYSASWDMVCFTVKRESDWAVISGIGNGSTQSCGCFDPSIGIKTEGILASTFNISKKAMSTLHNRISAIKGGGYDKDILVCISVKKTNNVDYGNLKVLQGKYDSRYFCVDNLLMRTTTGAGLSKNTSYAMTPYLKIDGKPIAAIDFWSMSNTSETGDVGVQFYDSNYGFVGTLDLTGYSNTGTANRRALVIESEDIPSGASYIRISATKANRELNILALSGGVQSYDSLNIVNFTSEHLFDKSSVERMNQLPFIKNTSNLYLSDLYLLTGGQVVISDIYVNETSNPTSGTTVAYMAFYNADREYIGILDYTDYFTGENLGLVTIAISPKSIPNGAKYITFFGYTGYLTSPKLVVGLTDLNDPAYNYPLIAELEEKVSKGFVKESLIPYETLNGVYMTTQGVRISADTSIRKYSVDGGSTYYYSSYLSSSSRSFYPIFFMDDEENVVGHSELSTGPELITDRMIVAPLGATQAWQNCFNDSMSYFKVSYMTDVPKVDELQEEVDVLEQAVSELGGTADRLMKVVINTLEGFANDSSFYLRSKYNSEKDIIITHYINGNGLISFDSAYVGSKDLSDIAVMTGANRVSSHNDSTAPLRGYTQYWHIFAQHGYPVPYFANSAGMTQADIGAKWKDQLNREYTIGKVTDAYIWLLPVIYLDGNGHYTRDWHSTVTSPTIETLTYVEGGSAGAYTTQITISQLYQEQLRPVMEHTKRTWIIDGRPISEAGTYYCDDFKVSETQLGYDPATVSSWFGGTGGTPDLSDAEVMAEFTASYNYKGAQCAVNTTINLLREAKGSYSGTQQQFFFDNGNYKAMFMIPKAAARDGVELDKPFNSPSASSTEYIISRTASHLIDVDDPVDRQIGFLYDDDADKYLVGMAAGLSLVSGDTVKDKRNVSLPVNYRLLDFSPANTNKFYIYAIDSSVYGSGYFPAGYIKEINYYISYFDPAENVGQVYWYKDGSSYVIYAHCQSEQHNLAINVPAIMEGLSIDVVEKTDDAELLTGTIQNGKFFVNYDSDNANYIVLKTK